MTGSSRKISARLSAYPAPAGDSPLYSANFSESGSKKASSLEAVLARPYPVGIRARRSSSSRRCNCAKRFLSSSAVVVMRSPRSAMVSETIRTRASSSGDRKNGRRKGQCTRSPNVSLALRMRLNKSSGSAGTRSRVDFKLACQSSAGDGGRTEGVGALTIGSRALRGSGSRSGRCFLPGSGALWRSCKSGGCADAKHLLPARTGMRSLAVQRAVDHQPRHLFHDVFEIKLRDAVALEIRCRIEEVDGIGHSIFYGELDGVHFVAQRLVDGLRIFHDAGAESRRQIFMVNNVFAFLGIVVNRENVRLAKCEAPYVLSEIDEFLQGHAVRRSFVVRREEFFFVVHLVDVLPTATGEGLQDGGPAHVIE